MRPGKAGTQHPALLRGLKTDRYREAGGGAINVNVNQFGIAVLPVEALCAEDWEDQSRGLMDMQNKIAQAAGETIEGSAEVLRSEPIKRGG